MPVVGTKVHRPSLRRRLVERERLTDQLQGKDARQVRLVLIAAPAGFGKTTLMAQWLESIDSERTVAWLSLDAADADLGRFLQHLVASVQAIAPAAGADAIRLLEEGGAPPAEGVLVSLVNDLDALVGPMVIAFDDYHVVDEPAVHEAVSFLLENLPPQVTLMMTTRADPPLPLSRLRVRDELVEIRASDLRFTPDEAEVFLNEVMRLDLEAGLVTALEERTEGWVAGLQLAAVSARSHAGSAGGREAVGEFVEDFSGSHRFVLDYLVEEVLDQLPDEVRDFLLTTSVLDQLTAPLCDALTGRPDSQQMLEKLERENLFVVPLDDERGWYRYHHLFADALRARLTPHEAARVGELHAEASRWLAAHGLLRDAVAHGLVSGDGERAADLVELGLADLRRRRENRTIREWLVALPESVVRRRPLLAMYMAWRHLSKGDLDGVTAWLDAAEDGQSAAPAPHGVTNGVLEGAVRDRNEELRSVPAMIEVYRASVAQARGDVDGTVEHARKALALAGPEDHFPRGAAAGFVGMAAWAAGDPVAAIDMFTDAVDSLRNADMVADELGATVVLADMWMTRGRPSEARRLLERALERASSSNAVLPVAGDLHVGLAEILREQGDLDAAVEHLERARQLGELGSVRENRHRWHVTMAAVRQSTGDSDGAVESLDEAEPLYLPGFFPELRPIPTIRARVRIRQNRLGAARAWARARQIGPADDPTDSAEFDQLTLARLLIAEGEEVEAIGLLDRVVSAARPSGRDGTLVDALTARALAHRASGDIDAAVSDLSAAIDIGVPAGYRRLFLDEGPPIIDLLQAVVRTVDADARSHAESLLAAERESVAPMAAIRVGNALVEPLSGRELEVLGLLDSELSGPEIASELFVSINTFRTHTKHIFTKLGVNTRRAAVHRARELGLR